MLVTYVGHTKVMNHQSSSLAYLQASYMGPLTLSCKIHELLQDMLQKGRSQHLRATILHGLSLS